MANKIIYQNSREMISIEFLYEVGGYYTYEVLVSTYDFSGKCNFCIQENKLNEYIKKLDYISENLSGKLEIQDCESDSFLTIYFENSLNLYVIGQIGGSWESNILKFKMKADQTILYGLKKNLLDY